MSKLTSIEQSAHMHDTTIIPELNQRRRATCCDERLDGQRQLRRVNVPRTGCEQRRYSVGPASLVDTCRHGANAPALLSPPRFHLPGTTLLILRRNSPKATANWVSGRVPKEVNEDTCDLGSGRSRPCSKNSSQSCFSSVARGMIIGC